MDPRIELVKQFQSDRWNELNNKSTWSDQDFQEVIYCHSEPVIENGQIEPGTFDVAMIEQLCFDVRTPKIQADRLLKTLKSIQILKSIK